MTINHGNTTAVSNLNVDRSSGSLPVENSSIPQTVVPPNPITVDDRIALSVATNFVQQANSVGEDTRIARIQELRTAIEKSQYAVDPKVVSHALIESELQGRS